MREWINCNEILPEEGVIVETKIDDNDNGNSNHVSACVRLFRRGCLWFCQDGNTYVYYRPTHWRLENYHDASI